jgi:hypothetical protein
MADSSAADASSGPPRETGKASSSNGGLRRADSLVVPKRIRGIASTDAATNRATLQVFFSQCAAGGASRRMASQSLREFPGACVLVVVPGIFPAARVFAHTRLQLATDRVWRARHLHVAIHGYGTIMVSVVPEPAERVPRTRDFSSPARIATVPACKRTAFRNWSRLRTIHPGARCRVSDHGFAEKERPTTRQQCCGPPRRQIYGGLARLEVNALSPDFSDVSLAALGVRH